MNVMLCWHRPGRAAGRWMTCRHCGVAIEWCPCVLNYRNVNARCRICSGSGWVAIVRSQKAKFAEYIEEVS